MLLSLLMTSAIGPLNEAPIVRPKDTYPEGVNVEFVATVIAKR
jgi:hypothetical protein